MYQDIIKKINLLIEMADSNNTFESLSDELHVLSKDITRLKKDATNLENVSENKYLRSSERLIDENIKISLENKVSKFQSELNDVIDEIEKISFEEDEFHTVIENLKSEIRSLNNFLNSLELKAKTIGGKDKSSYEFYENLIDDVNKEIDGLQAELEAKEGAYDLIKKRLESYSEKRVFLESNIKSEKNKLADTIKYLENPENYVDKTMQENDSLRLDEIEEEISSLEKRKNEIITDPIYIGHEAISFLKEDDITSAIDKVEELVTILNSKPYMNYSKSELADALESLKAKRDEFAEIIEGKDYQAKNNTYANKRIEFIDKIINSNKKEQLELEDKIRNIDVSIVKDLMDHIKDIHSYKDSLENEIANYKDIIEQDNDYKTPKKKAGLKIALSQKVEELEYITSLLQKYEFELESIIIKSKKLEENDLMSVKNTIALYEKEKKEILDNINVDSKAKDILAYEKDKTELKKLSDEVDLVVTRMSYDKKPDEIFDEIELSLKGNHTEKQKEIKEDDFVDLSEYMIDSLDEVPEIELSQMEDDSKDNNFEVEDVPGIDFSNVDIPEPEKIEEFDNLDNIFDEIDSSAINDKWKVIKVEPINDEPEKLIDDNFMVNDFDDTDYISFNDLLEGDNNDN